MMRRLAAVVLAACLAVSCKSAGGAGEAADARVTKAQEAEAKRAGKEAEKRRGRERTDGHLGIVYTPERNVTLRSGKLRVELRGKVGSFNIYAVDAQGRETAVFSTADDSSTTFFSVLVGRREYRLNKAASVAAQVRKTAGGAQIAYTLEKQFQAALDFSLLSSETGGEADIVRLTMYVTNLAGSRQALALRAVLDTVLGEGQPYHFETASRERISGETQFSSPGRERFFCTGNGMTTAQFLVEGKTMQPPQLLTFANRDALSSGPFFPVVQADKSFTSIMAYSNSAVCINWPYFGLEPGETTSLTFYVAVGTDGDSPKGLRFVDALADGAQVGADVPFGTGEAVPDADDDWFDPVYVQDLIDRINALSSDPEQVDRAEVRRLNAELDVILARMGRLNRQ